MPQTQIVTGPAISTADMHEVQIQGSYDPNKYREFANEWFEYYTLSVSAPAGWTFQGNPWINLVGSVGGESIGDAQAAFSWNNFGAAHDRFYVIQRTPNYIQCACWAGSHPMQVNIACSAMGPGAQSHFQYDESDHNQKAFAVIGKKLIAGEAVSETERVELRRLAKEMGLPKAFKEDCYWICDSGFARNPDQQLANCNCHQVCF